MKNQYTITKGLMNSWGREIYLDGIANIILFILWWVILIASAFLTAFNIWYGLGWFQIYISSVCLLLAIYKLFIQRRLIWSKRYKMLSTMFGLEEWVRTIEFLDDEIVATEHNSLSKFKYENIKKIKEKDDYVMISLKGNMAIRLYKNSFVEGSWEECKNFLELKTK